MYDVQSFDRVNCEQLSASDLRQIAQAGDCECYTAYVVGSPQRIDSSVDSPETLVAKYKNMDDLFSPSASELQTLFSLYGGTFLQGRRPGLYAVELPGKSIVGTRAQLWRWYLARRDALEAMRSRSIPF